MSELDKEVQKDLREDPLADAVNKIAEHVVESDKKTKSDIEDVEKKVERATEDLDSKVEKGFADVMDRFEQLKKRGSALNYLRFEDTTEPIRAALSDEIKAKSAQFEAAAGLMKGEKLQDPVTFMGAHQWFKLSTQLQTKGGGSNHRAWETFDKLNKAFNEASVVKAASHLQEDTAAEGGHLVPTIVASEIQRQILDAGRVFPRCRQMALSVKSTKVPAISNAVSCFWIEEESAMTASGPEFSQLTLQAEKLASTARMSIELLEDSNVGLLPWLLSVFTEKQAAELDKQVVVGDSSGPVITGIVNGASVNALTSGTAAGRALTYGLLVQAYMGASQANSRDGGVWICSPAGFQELLELLDANSRPLVSLTGAEVRGPAPMTLFGKEIIESGSLGGAADPSLDDNTNSNTTICFGPLSSYIFGTRQGMRWDVTDQVSWSNYQIDCRLVGRYAGVPGVSANFTKLTHITTA